MTPGKGSEYREFYDLSGRITCMDAAQTKHVEHVLFDFLLLNYVHGYCCSFFFHDYCCSFF